MEWGLCEYLRLDGTGTEQITADYSVTNGLFYFEAPKSEEDPNLGIAVISRLNVFIEDTAGWRAESYGDGPVLPNGLIFSLLDENDNVVQDLCSGTPIVNNGSWGSIGGDFRLANFGAGNDMATVWFQSTNSGTPFVLRPGFKIALQARDDFTFLTAHTCHVNGYYPWRAPTQFRKFLDARVAWPAYA